MSAVPVSLRMADHRGSEVVAPTEFVSLVQRLHRSTELEPVAAALVNDGRLWTHWDRISLLLRVGRRWKVIAVSGQAVIARSSPTVLRLADLTARIMKSACPWSCDRAEAVECAPEIAGLLAEYWAVSSPRRMQLEPLFLNAETEESTAPAGRQRVPFAALVFEDFETTAGDAGRADRSESLVRQGELALGQARRWNLLWGRSLWLALGEAWASVTASRLALALGSLIILAMAVGWLVLTPADVPIDATGRLVPQHQARIFAPVDAEVAELLVQSGERVVPDQPLLRLRDTRLQEDLVVTHSRLAEAEQASAGVKAELHELMRSGGERSTVARLQTRLNQLKIEIEGHRRRLELLDAAAEHLTVRASIGGIVTTPEVSQRLNQRPVRRGDLLLELADDRGNWQLELQVPEREFGKFFRDVTPQAFDQVELDYRRLAQPREVLRARVTAVGTRTVTVAEIGPCIPVTAELLDPLPAEASIGADIEARLVGPPSTYADVLFGDLVDALYRWAWW